MSMKKFAALATALVLTLTMGMTAMAAPSPAVSGVVTSGIAVDKNGNKVDLVIEELPSKYQDAVAELNSKETLKNLLGSAYVDGMTVIDVKEVRVEGQGITFPVTITFDVPGVISTTKVAVLHYNTDSSQWEVVPSKAGNGTIEATFDSLSPVAFVVDKNTMASSASSTSPKTGENSMTTALMAVIVCAVGGIYVLSRKARA